VGTGAGARFEGLFGFRGILENSHVLSSSRVHWWTLVLREQSCAVFVRWSERC
jgi:hypothetical protein